MDQLVHPDTLRILGASTLVVLVLFFGWKTVEAATKFVSAVRNSPFAHGSGGDDELMNIMRENLVGLRDMIGKVSDAQIIFNTVQQQQTEVLSGIHLGQQKVQRSLDIALERQVTRDDLTAIQRHRRKRNSKT